MHHFQVEMYIPRCHIHLKILFFSYSVINIILFLRKNILNIILENYRFIQIAKI